MFGDIAIRLLKLMGHSGTVPSAILPEDIPAALERLQKALTEEWSPTEYEPGKANDELGEQTVSLRTRAFPLIELLEAAAQADVPVMWD